MVLLFLVGSLFVAYAGDLCGWCVVRMIRYYAVVVVVVVVTGVVDDDGVGDVIIVAYDGVICVVSVHVVH